MSLSILLGESEPWLLGAGACVITLLIATILILRRGGQRKQAKSEEEKVLTPTPEESQDEVVEVGQQNTHFANRVYKNCVANVMNSNSVSKCGTTVFFYLRPTVTKKCLANQRRDIDWFRNQNFCGEAKITFFYNNFGNIFFQKQFFSAA